MFRNYIKIAWRNLVKNKVYSFINIVGLATGMAVALLIGLWIWDELSFDTGHSNYEHIAKIRQNISVNGEVQTGKEVPYALEAELRNEYGRYFKYIVLSSNRANRVLAYGDKNLLKGGVYLGPEAPEMFTLNMLKGTRAGLRDPHAILLAESVAKAFFGDIDPVNKVMKIDNRFEVKVTGVYKDLPDNSTLANVKFIAPFDLLASNEKWISAARDSWKTNSVQAYVQLADGVDMKAVSAIIKDIRLKKVSATEARYKPELFLEPMSKWHLYQEYRNGVNAGGRILYVWMFGIIGLFVLLLACINFMNLSTARSEKRAKETGIRKTMGSSRGQLIAQFFCESVLLALFAFVCSLLLVQLTLPFFNSLADKKLIVLWSDPLFWLAGIMFSIATGLVAGSYPALYLSSFQPVKVLKGTFKASRFAAVPRKALVVLQFTVSVTLIICTVVVWRQVQFAKDRPIGYSTNGLITVPLTNSDMHPHFEVVKNELLKNRVIVSMAGSQAPATDTWGTEGAFTWKGKDPDLMVDFPTTGVSVDYGKTVGWQFSTGRDFSTEHAMDSSSLILNESAVTYMGLKDPVGESIKWGEKFYTVIGVIKDVITESPYEAVRPSLFWLNNGPANFIFLKINPANSAGHALREIENVFKEFNPAAPFNYSFADEDYARKFNNEVRAGRLASFFAVLAVFIACLGLWGLASYTAEQRTKEIGVRKVLGASVYSLWQLLSKEFVALVIISLFIATPLAYYFMSNWLQNYQYRSGMPWWIFALAAFGALTITLCTVSFQAIRAAHANPVKSLRTE